MRVVIVGGGTVGLCTAVFLARQGVSVHVLERRARVNDHPRAFGITDRSAEILREAGIEVDTAHFGRGLMTGPSLAELTAVTHKFERPEIGPAKLGSCPQDRIDRAALALLRELGSRVDFDSEVTAITDGSVTTADGRVVEGDYVIAADGIRSRVPGAARHRTDRPGSSGQLTHAQCTVPRGTAGPTPLHDVPAQRSGIRNPVPSRRHRPLDLPHKERRSEHTHRADPTADQGRDRCHDCRAGDHQPAAVVVNGTRGRRIQAGQRLPRR